MNIFIVEAYDEDGEKYQYEYGNYPHAKEHLDSEKKAFMYECKDNVYYFVEGK